MSDPHVLQCVDVDLPLPCAEHSVCTRNGRSILERKFAKERWVGDSLIMLSRIRLVMRILDLIFNEEIHLYYLI